MASTEHRLGEQHLAGCLALSKSAHWNQNEADWRLMLGFGRGWGITLDDGTLAASTLVLPYGERFAWVAMVLVLPEHRRKGFATQLLKKALAENAGAGLVSLLDATPAGREVYRQEGFRDTWGFKRFSLSKSFSIQGKARAITESDWPRILELDRRAFGADREIVLRNLARRLPQAALVSESGFVLGREGREATQIGPLVARNESGAADLLAAALASVRPPVYLDLLDSRPEITSRLEKAGFEFQRPFTRMVHTPGEALAPGEAGLVYCPAGPELG
jgi:GNAT superfamily N-acetyltransferase